MALAKRARAATSQLFPLPVQAIAQFVGRKRARTGRRRWAEAQATRALTLLSGLALNWEATGRPHVPGATQYRPNAAQRRAVCRLREAAASMIRAARGVELRRLGLGRGKIAEGWRTLDKLTNAVRQMQGGAPYGRASALHGSLGECGHDGPETVDVSRVALPAVAPHFDLTPYLLDAELRAGYLDPATLEQPVPPPEETTLVLVLEPKIATESTLFEISRIISLLRTPCLELRCLCFYCTDTVATK